MQRSVMSRQDGVWRVVGERRTVTEPDTEGSRLFNFTGRVGVVQVKTRRRR